MTDKDDRIELTKAQKSARRKRSIALALALAAFVVIFYLVTVIKFGPEILNRPL
ncbi:MULTISPECIES: hypothetical protein [unclassified Roseitalea]|uniref:hypothetical protein n=1 Tax=unclassified Roseitalea TaxID=2639107 RepID=UPI00273F78A1|nr:MULTISPECIES: hypothetical protein [unclassified Roseitalea]